MHFKRDNFRATNCKKCY